MAASCDVAGLNIVIVGGTTGLGLSAAKALVENGARVVICGRSQGGVDAALGALGSDARGFAGDAVDPSIAEKAVALALGEFGRLDALYHVAGGSGRSEGDGPLHEITDGGWEFTLNLNLASVFHSNRSALRQFLAQGGGGTILNMSSVLAWSPSPGHFATHAYAAAKAAVIGLSKAAASFYAPHNIRVNVIAPALVETPMSRRAAGNDEIMRFMKAKQPLGGGRIGLPADLDGAALFLLSRQSHFITGQVLAVDGGWCVSDGTEPKKTGMLE
jgi:NAD(P)-dependent dehydrogenase (short-subunit alcohol dehydrogenase family)